MRSLRTLRPRSKRTSSVAPEQSPLIVVVEIGAEVTTRVAATAPAPWKVDQLHALGPMTGPSHRTFVPIVRSTSKDGSPRSLTDTSLPPQP
jgi:hypothetical protein